MKKLFIILTLCAAAILFTAAQEADSFDLYSARVAAGTTHSMFLSPGGSLWVWGENTFGQLGNGYVTVYGEHYEILVNHDAYEPIHIMDGITEIAAGHGFSLALTVDGELYSWGRNDFGQLGDGTRTDRAIPERIMEDVAFINARHNTAAAVKTDGSLWVWGFSVTVDWLDENPVRYHAEPVFIMDNVQSAAVASSYILILTGDNNLYGIGTVRDLGIGISDPNLVTGAPMHVMSGILSVVTSNQRSLAITLDGRLYGWGPNPVGSGSLDFWVFSPEFVKGGVKAAFPGMFLCNENNLWIWGDVADVFLGRLTTPEGRGFDSGGMLMDTIVDYGRTPIRIMSNVLTAAGGGFHFLAVDREVNVYAWGANQFGQLGTGLANVYDIELWEEDFGHGSFYMPFPVLAEDNNEVYPVRVGHWGGY